MIRFFRELKCFLAARAYPANLKWEKEDAAGLTIFFRSQAGRKLMARMVEESFEQDRHATVRAGDPRFNNGVAIGFRIAIATLQTLATPEADSGKTAHSPNGVDELRERLTP